MLFIKNLTNLTGDKIGLTMTSGEEISVALKIADTEPVTLTKSKIQSILSNLRKSFEYIGTTTNHLEKGEVVDVISTEIMSNKVTELNFFSKETKTVFTETSELPVVIGEYDADTANDKHFPRDMIVFIVPNGENDDYKLIIDERNLGAPVLIKDIGEYRIIGVFSKYPIWANLKFPAYMYIKNGNDNIAGFKLGSTTNKKLTKNSPIEVNVTEAVDYLNESFRIIKERKSQNDSKKHDNNKPGQGSGKKFTKGQKPNNGRTNIPSKFRNGKGTRETNGRKYR